MPQQLQRSRYPFLKDEELNKDEYIQDIQKAQELNHKRYLENKEAVNRAFVEETKNAKHFAESRAADVTEQLTRYKQAAEGNEVVALDMFLYNNPGFRAELNRLRPDAPISYRTMAASSSEAEYARYLKEEEAFSPFARAATESGDVPGQGNTLQTTVSQSILYRIDNFNPVISQVTKINLLYSNYDASDYNNYGLAGYITESANIPDNTANLTDATNGIQKTNFQAKQFGISFVRSYLSGKRISPTVINQELNFTEMEIGRGEAFQIMSGTGVGLNDNGLVNIATAATAGANVLETAANAKSEVETANATAKAYIMNAKAWNEHVKLSTVNLAYQNTIDVNRQMLWSKPVIVVGDEIMPTVSNVAKVVVGDYSHYIKFTNGGLDKLDLTNTNTAAKIAMYLMARDGGAVFADSFATYDVVV